MRALSGLRITKIIFVAILISFAGVSAPGQSQPNILFIFADDWGYGDLGCHGHAYVKTPNIDRLAEEGVDFTNFTVASSICSPSRTGVLTGCFPARFNVTGHFHTTRYNEMQNQGDWVDPELVMLPRLLGEAGYATAHFGKWHLSSGFSDAPVPNVYGFDEVGAFNSSAPRMPVHQDAERAIAFIKKSHNEGKPFFINMWLHEPHTPFYTLPEYLERFSDLDEGDKIYASVLYHADDRIGQVLDELDRLGLKENTLVIFSSDNGPAGSGKKGGKISMDEATGIVSGHGPCMGTTGGRKGRKGTLWQGGIGIPFIARWPGKIPAGEVDDISWISAVDLLPTFCEAAGVTLPPDYKPDGISQLATLKGEKSPLREKPLFWKRQMIGKGAGTGADYAILDGKWKLLASINSDVVELYDVSIDPYEKNDVQVAHPERVSELVKKLEAWKGTLPAHPDPKCFSKERGNSQ